MCHFYQYRLLISLAAIATPSESPKQHQLLKLIMNPNLPAFLQIKDTNNPQGKEMFTKELIRCGEKFFTDIPYAFEIIGASLEDLRMLCHHCLEMVPSGSGVVCSYCKVIGY